MLRASIIARGRQSRREEDTRRETRLAAFVLMILKNLPRSPRA